MNTHPPGFYLAIYDDGYITAQAWMVGAYIGACIYHTVERACIKVLHDACMPSHGYILVVSALFVTISEIDARATKCLLLLLLLLAVFSFDVTYACYAAAFTLIKT
jgi:hypothetical protein